MSLTIPSRVFARMTLAALLASSAQQALAQENVPSAADESGVTEIVVTAQKREERLQDVPVAVTVISGTLLERQGAISLEGAQYLVPTLNFRKSGTTLNQSLFLRGVGTSTFSIAGEPSVSTVVDGVVYARAGEAFSDLVDIERLEVLRGPQGTLFGKNASAGVVNIITRRPGDTLTATIDGGYFFGEGNEYRLRAAADIPLGEGIATRVTGFYGSYQGNIFNEAANVRSRVNGYEHYGVRAVVVAQPSDNLTFTLIGDWRKAEDDCCAEVIGTVPTNAAAGQLPTPLGDETRRVRQNLVTRTNEEAWGVSLQVDATLADHTVTSITAYRDYANEEIRDGDWLEQAFVGVPQLHDTGPQTGNTFSQELRFQSPTNQLVEYVGGLFYSRAESERTFSRSVIQCTIPGNGFVPCSAAGTVITRPFGTATFGSVFKNLAAFAQATVNVSDSFRLVGGIRYTHDQLDVFHQRFTTLAGPGIQANFGPFTGKTTNDNWSGKAGIQLDLVPESTFYASYARGYKGPAFNVFFNLNATGTNVIEPETADSYEAGLKNTLFGGKLIVNLAGYYAKYKNFQANNPDLVAGVVVTRFTNAGTVSTRGAELDLLWRPVRDVNISGGLAYTDAKVDRFRAPVGGNVNNIIPDGTPLAYAPKWKASLSGDWRIRTGGSLDVELASNLSYQSRQLSQFDANAVVRNITTIGAYALVDASIALVDSADRFRLALQVKNAFDQSFAAAITSGGPGGSYRYIIPREADRYFGIVGKVSF